MAYDFYNTDIDPNLIYQNYQTVSFIQPITNVAPGTTPITTINGNSGQAAGPSITLSGGSTGLDFTATGNTISITGTLAVASGGTGAVTAPAARTNLGAAASGINTDITQLNGASQVDVTTAYKVAGTKVVGAQGAAVPDAVGGATIDTEARTAVNDLLARLRAHGLIA